MTGWSNLGADVEAAFEEHRQAMVMHFINLRLLDGDLARASLANYVGMNGCPFPAISEDVKAAWSAYLASQKNARIDAPEPAGSRST